MARSLNDRLIEALGILQYELLSRQVQIDDLTEQVAVARAAAPAPVVGEPPP